ncbi:MAG: Hsp20/alpha crystallin family protein [Candidatus Obscuribacterales bacterium]|nr:Hsp20/alpha crystallin family protein [Candidatus Obscuribacterales bacterium]
MSKNLKLGLAFAATLVVGFAGGFATKSGIDFFRPTITTAYSCVAAPIKPHGEVWSARGVRPVNYGAFFEPFDFQFSPFDLDNSFSQSLNVPSIETEETNTELRLVANLPGIEQKNVQVDIQPHFITIKGNQVDKEAGQVVKSESFVRSMNLPNNVDSRRAQQGFKDGVLTISIPKIDANDAQCKSKQSMTSGSI